MRPCLRGDIRCSYAQYGMVAPLVAACGGVVDADVDEKQVMRLVRRQKDVVVQDCAVVLFGLCEACAKKQAEG